MLMTAMGRCAAMLGPDRLRNVSFSSFVICRAGATGLTVLQCTLKCTICSGTCCRPIMQEGVSVLKCVS